MERIQALILKLKEQAEQQADVAQMLVTVQLIQHELTSQQQSVKMMGTSKVAVVMPAAPVVDMSKYSSYLPKKIPAPVEVEREQEPEINQKTIVRIEPAVNKNGQLDMDFDPLVDIPTLSQQSKDYNDHHTDKQSSLNDRLRQGKSELGDKLKDSPVKDLRKAIGINDRFVFINDLFRGDEAMYERSIKTINGFNIHAEAEYWIRRELKTKIGWNPESPVVAQFDKLIKRRFS